MSEKSDWMSYLPSKWQSEIRTAQLRGKIPIEDLFRFQILRCQATAADEQVDAIKLLFDMIPDSWRDDEFTEAIENTIKIEGKWIPRRISGGGTLSKDPKSPLICNRQGIDLDYDPDYNARSYKITYDENGREENVEEVYEVGGPFQISPEWKVIESQDWNEVFHNCINLFDRRQLLITKISKEVIPSVKEGKQVFVDDDEGPDS